MTVRVLVVDDSHFFRQRLTAMLSADAHIEVIGTACDGADAVKKAHTLQPDVTTMDVEMPTAIAEANIANEIVSRDEIVSLFGKAG